MKKHIREICLTKFMRVPGLLLVIIIISGLSSLKAWMFLGGFFFFLFVVQKCLRIKHKDYVSMYNENVTILRPLVRGDKDMRMQLQQKWM